MLLSIVSTVIGVIGADYIWSEKKNRSFLDIHRFIRLHYKVPRSHLKFKTELKPSNVL